MKAIWNNTVIAEADKQDLIRIEGNWYFPSNSIVRQYFKPSNHHTTCFWKGEASYYNIEVNESVNENAAWFYPHPLPAAISQVKKDFSDYVAFWQGIEIKE